MKSIVTLGSYLTRATLITALALVAGVASGQQKGAERLVPATSKSPALVSKSESLKHSSPQCQDVVKQLPDSSAKGGQILIAGGRPTHAVAQHACQACATAIKTEGQGKARTEVAHHTCTAASSVTGSCCAPAKATVSTPGI